MYIYVCLNIYSYVYEKWFHKTIFTLTTHKVQIIHTMLASIPFFFLFHIIFIKVLLATHYIAFLTHNKSQSIVWGKAAY